MADLFSLFGVTLIGVVFLIYLYFVIQNTKNPTWPKDEDDWF